MGNPGVCNSHDEQAIAVIADSVAGFVTVRAIGAHNVLCGDSGNFDPAKVELVLKIDDVIKESLTFALGVSIAHPHYSYSPQS